jgi:hypothetical protein
MLQHSLVAPQAVPGWLALRVWVGCVLLAGWLAVAEVRLAHHGAEVVTYPRVCGMGGGVGGGSWTEEGDPTSCVVVAAVKTCLVNGRLLSCAAAFSSLHVRIWVGNTACMLCRVVRVQVLL